MKKLCKTHHSKWSAGKIGLVLIFLLLQSSVLFAQSLQLVSSSPAQLESNVPLQATIVLNFNTAVTSDSFDPDKYGDRFIIVPMEKASIGYIAYSPDSTTVSIDVLHQPNTDYTLALMGVESSGGLRLDRTIMINYSTAATISDVTISGGITFVNNPFMFSKNADFTDEATVAATGQISELVPEISVRSNALRDGDVAGYLKSLVMANGAEVSYAHSVVILLDSPDYLNQVGEGDDGPPTGIVMATTADPTTGAYVMPNVRPGTYYLAAFIFFEDDDDDGDSAAFGYYRDLDGAPLPIEVSDASILAINFEVYGFLPELLQALDAREAYEAIHSIMMSENADLKLFAMFGSHGFDNWFFKSAQSALMETMMPNGSAYIWQFVYVDLVAEKAEILFSMGPVIIHRMTMLFEDIPEDEFIPVDISRIPMIPDTFISSSSAVQSALSNGMAAQLQMAMQQENWHLDYELSGFWFEYPELLEEGDHPYWAIRLEYGFWDDRAQLYRFTEADYLVDAVTGEFIGERIREGEERPPQPEPLRLMSVSPQPFSTGVPLRSEIAFEFNEPLDPFWFSASWIGEFFYVYPAGAFELKGSTFSNDNRTVTFDVEHQPDTEYTWVLTSPVSQNQQLISQAFVLRYTTGTTFAPNEVSGSVTFLNQPHGVRKLTSDRSVTWVDLQSTVDLGERFFSHSLVMLVDEDHNPNDFTYRIPTTKVRAVAVLDSTTGAFTIPHVPNGSYRVVSYLLDNRYNNASVFAMGYLRDANNDPIAIQVNNGNIGGLEIAAIGFRPDLFVPLTSRETAAMARNHVHGMRPSSELMAMDMMESRHMYWKSDFEAASEADKVAIRRVMERAAAGSPSAGTMDEPNFPTGKGLYWTLTFYDAASDMVDRVHMTGAFILDTQSFRFADMDEYEKPPVALETIPRIPAVFVESEQALAVALQHGLQTVVDGLHPHAWVEMEYLLSGFYWNFPELMSAASDLFWEIRLLSHYYPDMNAEMEYVDAVFLVNAETGAFIESFVETSVDVDVTMPVEVSLSQNYPNPFNPSTLIAFSLPQDASVKLAVYDVMGRMVTKLVDGYRPAGTYSVRFDGASLSSGVYLYRLEVDGRIVGTQKMTLVK